MKVGDLVDNREFSFNVVFHICMYTPTEEDIDHMDILYDSESNQDIPYNVMGMYISAINQNDDGVLEIECY